jgi:hypothetical protein
MINGITSGKYWAGVVAASLLVAPGVGRAQLPGSDIWLAPLSWRSGEVRIGDPVNVTARPGYDNQPAFLPGGHAFLYSAGDTAGTDVWRWQDGAITRVTRTPESEYSPTPDPGGGTFCTVRVEADGAQRLWRFEANGTRPRLVMTAVDSVGYFEWLDGATLAAFVVGEPHTLRIIDVPSQREQIIAANIGRFIRRVPGTDRVSFTVADEDGTHRFMTLAAGATRPLPLIAGTAAGQDAVWTGDVLIASSGSEIFASRPLGGDSWVRIADARGWGVSAVTRMAVSGDGERIAIVCGE